MYNPLSNVPNEELFQWNGSHSDFVTMVILMTGVSPQGFDDPEIQEKIEAMGEILLNIIKIDITPYPDFKTMYAEVPPSPNLILKIMECLEKHVAFDEMIDGTGVEASLETQAEELYGTLMGWEMVRRLGPYVQFGPGSIPHPFQDPES
jgi:hypothetical protein